MNTSRTYHKDRTVPPPGVIWVFGSNLAGRHGKGAAEVAKERFGAQRYVGVGRTGQSYGIPTKDGRKHERPMAILPLDTIKGHIANFVAYAVANPQEKFFITRVGCELAGYSDQTIAPLFNGAPANCSLPEDWKQYMADFSGPCEDGAAAPLPGQASLF